MLLRRITEHVKTQNWSAVAIDFAIVVIGVFMGTQVSNWNDARAERQILEKSLSLLLADLRNTDVIHDTLKYYETTSNYGQRALRGWEGDPSVDDTAFIIASYQASQVLAGFRDVGTYAALIGSGEIKSINDEQLQELLVNYLSYGEGYADYEVVNTPYRQNVRRAMPHGVQALIRKQCGDQYSPANDSYVLPTACSVSFEGSDTALIAKSLRARNDLRDDLRWHLATIATVQLDGSATLRRRGDLADAIDAYLQ